MNVGQKRRLQVACDECKSFSELNEAHQLGKDAIDGMLTNLQSVCNEVAEEEREKFDNMPEGLQASPTGEKLEENADLLEGLDFPDVDEVDWSSDDAVEEFIEEVMNVIDEIEAIL